MGRHSAPEDDEPSAAPPYSAVDVDVAAPVGAAPGRHENADADAETTTLPRIETSPPPVEGTKPRAESGTHGDLRLLRERPALRARCAAAAIVPFLLYTAVLAVIGRADIYLLWVWIPTVTAGIAVGGFLDAAHRHDRKQSGE
ncbi:MAG: hypothetical protein QOG22_2955 [Pseudonocardiales bacterium]|jgi:hypothetical protein|nr:hypothetical protein [Pseudonocardiales bacterium]MDT4972812.1 hypothetical protein [Pseudonocardiales bacterium]